MNLKELAKARGTNLKQVAEKCGIPASTLYAISRGDTNFENVGIGTAIRVAGSLGMTVEELYLGKTQEQMSSELKEGALSHSSSHDPFEEMADSSETRELMYLYKNMDSRHREMLVETVRSFAGLSEKNEGGVREDVERAEYALR